MNQSPVLYDTSAALALIDPWLRKHAHRTSDQGLDAIEAHLQAGQHGTVSLANPDLETGQPTNQYQHL
jgi:hypothetical protein